MKQPIKERYLIKSELFKTLLLSIILSSGMNFIIQFFSDNKEIYLFIGLPLIVLSLILYFKIEINKIVTTEKIDGTLIFDDGEFLLIPGYIVSENAHYIYENYIKERPNNKMGEELDRDLIKELIEYFIIINLSKCSRTISKDKEVIHPGEIRINNKFLSCFSDYSKIGNKSEQDEGELIGMFSENGLYLNSDIYVPKRTKISKKEESILLDLPKFMIEITVKIKENNYYVDSRKLKLLGIEKFIFDGIGFVVNINIKTKWKYYFSFNKDKLYEWLDDFINLLIDSMNEENFEKKYYIDTITYWNSIFNNNNNKYEVKK